MDLYLFIMICTFVTLIEEGIKVVSEKLILDIAERERICPSHIHSIWLNACTIGVCSP